MLYKFTLMQVNNIINLYTIHFLYENTLILLNAHTYKNMLI